MVSVGAHWDIIYKAPMPGICCPWNSGWRTGMSWIHRRSCASIGSSSTKPEQQTVVSGQYAVVSWKRQKETEDSTSGLWSASAKGNTEWAVRRGCSSAVVIYLVKQLQIREEGDRLIIIKMISISYIGTNCDQGGWHVPTAAFLEE